MVLVFEPRTFWVSFAFALFVTSDCGIKRRPLLQRFGNSLKLASACSNLVF